MQTARLIVDPPLPGHLNMAIDQALLASANTRGLITIRFYFWEEPTLSLGYFQPSNQRAGHRPSLSCPLVRRATGGGAIVHDRELTYSICLPQQNRFSAEHARVYEVMHQSLIDCLTQLEIPGARMFGRLETAKTGEAEPFLCFQRRSPTDVVLGPDKVCGSAQRRLDEAILQHGSLLLGRSPRAPELPGINEISGRNLRSADIWQLWAAAAARTLRVRVEEGELDEVEMQSAEEICRTRFAHSHWTNRR